MFHRARDKIFVKPTPGHISRKDTGPYKRDQQKLEKRSEDSRPRGRAAGEISSLGGFPDSDELDSALDSLPPVLSDSTPLIPNGTPHVLNNSIPRKEVPGAAVYAIEGLPPVYGALPEDLSLFGDIPELQRVRNQLAKAEAEKETLAEKQNADWSRLQEMRDKFNLEREAKNEAQRLLHARDEQLGGAKWKLDIADNEKRDLQIAHDADLREKERKLSEVSHTLQGVQKELSQALDVALRAQKEKDSIRQKWVEVSSALTKLQSEINYKADDSFFIGWWKTLQSQIESLALGHFGGRLVNPKKLSRGRSLSSHIQHDEEPAKQLFLLTSHCETYLGSDTRRPLIAQAFLWNMLSYCIFDSSSRYSSGLYWAGGLRKSLSRLRGELKPRYYTTREVDDESLQETEKEIREYNKWRATTTQLLLGKTPPPQILPDDVDEIVSDAIICLRPYFTNPTVNSQESFRKSFRDIVFDAIHLDGEMNQQRAPLMCAQWCNSDQNSRSEQPWGFPFDDSLMESVGGLVQYHNSQPFDLLVELVVSPALLKVGNAYGENLHVVSTLVKGRVVPSKQSVIRASRKGGRPPPAITTRGSSYRY